MVVGAPLRFAPERREARCAGLRFSLLGPGADIRPAVALAEAAHVECRFSCIPFSPAKLEAIIARIVARPAQSAYILAMRGSDVVGMLWCTVGEYHIGSDVLLTTIHNVAKPLRAMLAVGHRII
ncbi:hypothetical protein Mame_01666 [Martelella mediterranea DSM 17316]|uniref:Uncharacterized protein n=1 Tax=Martelella mediterranea DSM 17316 TaxID=1122214 RepID=A0A1U9YZZ8_9HYPH|nr:hypothetical protein Mame_01666 [Martelella mediterranea DSM 17316]